MRSTTDSSCFMGVSELWSMPRHNSHAVLPVRPNWSTRVSNAIAATSPMTWNPNRCMAAFTVESTGRRSMECGARKDAASMGTLVAPRGVLDMAATRAGNLAWATPTLGARSWGAELSREFTSLASPPYMSSSPSSPT